MPKFFKFSTSEIISRDTSSYPITVAEVKQYSKYFQLNPTDTTLDDKVQEYIVQMVDSWEKNTGYLLLDQTIKSYIPNIEVAAPNCEMRFCHLNIRAIDNVKYYSSEWNRSDNKTEYSDYWTTTEIINKPKTLRPNQALFLFPVEYNLEVQFKGGFENNNFTNLKSEIKDCLLFAVAQAVDTSKEICAQFYSGRITEIANKYTIQEEVITIF